ncbi:MAG TPA: hypothetical protein VIM12_01665 [Noviherbaspirillum sp.]|uniref:hypothetical protein n=1 Tax=Noviherbaspirillum sp. TaxID=1926288 RepID=UPI002F92EF5E
MTRQETPFEQVSYDLNKFRERRMAERRATPRGTADRRAAPAGDDAGAPGGAGVTQEPDSDETRA